MLTSDSQQFLVLETQSCTKIKPENTVDEVTVTTLSPSLQATVSDLWG